jgi:hypothetical protein
VFFLSTPHFLFLGFFFFFFFFFFSEKVQSIDCQWFRAPSCLIDSQIEIFSVEL